MTIADKLTLLANTKEALRAKLKLAKSVPFSKYPDYINWQNVPSIPNKAFYADLTNDRYVKDGLPCNFKDLFTFTRAGKAWLVKDTGLQEYAADVPRFDNGLLVEQSATNYWIDSNTYKSSPIVLESGGRIYRAVSYDFSIHRCGLNISSGEYIISAWFANTQSRTLGARIVVNPSLLAMKTPVEPNNKIMLYSAFRVTTEVGVIGYLLEGGDNNPTKLPIGITSGMVQKGTVISSYIPTTTTPVTRPADYLLNKITGTTVTGDWDSTLTLSIVAGKLVHSGYGRIRSLEIN